MLFLELLSLSFLNIIEHDPSHISSISLSRKHKIKQYSFVFQVCRE